MSLPIDASRPAFDEADAGDALRRSVAEAWLRVRARARAEGVAHHLALRVRVPDGDPLDAFLTAGDEDRFYWSQPEGGVDRAAAGAAWSLELEHGREGERDRFDVVAKAVGDLLERIEVIGDAAPGAAGPIIHAGFAYADRGATADGDEAWSAFPAARLVLARRQLARLDEGTFECRVASVSPDAADDGWQALFDSRSHRGAAHEGLAAPAADDLGPAYSVHADRPHTRYEADVADALAEIERGGLKKVVLARSLEVRHAGEFGLRQFLDQLRASYPACATFVVAHGTDCFVSASPERLIALEGDAIHTAALAGSAPRGRTPEADARLGDELIACPKNRAEHEAVRHEIVSVLQASARDVRAAEAPRLLKLAGIQHLETPIEARLGEAAGRPGEALLRLVAALHPTPAVGGLPAAAADAWLAAHEGLDRGWYAAPVGWIGADGSGELRVALRSALLRSEVDDARGAVQSTARLFAGAGIVAGSDPHAELVETRIKLRALLAPLTEI